MGKAYKWGNYAGEEWLQQCDVTNVEIDRLIGQTEMNWYGIAVAAGEHIQEQSLYVVPNGILVHREVASYRS